MNDRGYHYQGFVTLNKETLDGVLEPTLVEEYVLIQVRWRWTNWSNARIRRTQVHSNRTRVGESNTLQRGEFISNVVLVILSFFLPECSLGSLWNLSSMKMFFSQLSWTQSTWYWWIIQHEPCRLAFLRGEKESSPTGRVPCDHCNARAYVRHGNRRKPKPQKLLWLNHIMCIISGRGYGEPGLM